MKKLHELSDKAQRKAIKTIRELLGLCFLMTTKNGLIFTYADESHVLEKVINLVDLLPWLVENPQDDKMKTYIEENRRK